MSIGIRIRVGAAFSALALAATFAAVRPQPVHAAPAYSSSAFIAVGGVAEPGWAVLDIGTGQQHTVTPSGPGYSGGQVEAFRYSPDARQVAFATPDQATGGMELWVASADGTNAHRIAAGRSGGIDWSPDGRLIYFGSNGIQVVPADGSGPPTQAVPDPCGANPQVSTRGYIFYTRSCSSTIPASTAVYRPGDAAPTIVSTTTGVVSRDGSLIAHAEPFMSCSGSVTVVGIGGYPGRSVGQVCPQGSAMDFGPSGDLVITFQNIGNGPHWTFGLAIVDPGAFHDMDPIGGRFGSFPSYLQWVNGPSNLPAHPVADRVGGADRIGTAVDASRWSFDALGTPGRPAATAVLARDDLYPDALAGTALAVQRDGPLLLTPSGGLDQGVADELRRILGQGSTVYLLGGLAALSPRVEDAVRSLGYRPVRLGGADRYATAVAIATNIAGTHPKSVLLATGTNFPDALTAGTAAGQERYSLSGPNAFGGGVVLLTNGTTMPAATSAYLHSLKSGTATVYAVGGPAAAAMRSAGPRWPNLTPLVGADRYDTAAKVATSALFGHSAPGRYTMAAITTGLNFPDAMSGGALAGSQGAPLLLAGIGGLSPSENAIVRAGHLDDIAIVGGPAAVSPRVFTAAADTAFGPNTWVTYTNRLAPPLR